MSLKKVLSLGISVVFLGSISVGITVADELKDLSLIKPLTSHRSSSNDPTGNVDNVTSFAPGQTHIMLDSKGPGCIRHIWMTIAAFPGHQTVLRDLVLRMYWENATLPAVEVPLGDFFALGHGRYNTIRSVPVCVGDNPRALNCYWPMPFHQHGRIEIYNAGDRGIRRIYYNIDYELGAQDSQQGLFHALYRRDPDLPGQPDDGIKPQNNYVILETEGEGQFVGCVLSVDAAAKGWWGEGDEMIYVDRRDEPTIRGTGSEDYFCNAWGFSKPFSYPYYGVPLLEKLQNGNKLTTAYRWHITDPVRFFNYLKVTIEHIYPKNITNDYSSVAFWYQRQPIQKREALPQGSANHPQFDPPEKNTTGNYDIDGTELEVTLRWEGLDVLAVTTEYSKTSRGGYLRIRPGAQLCALPLNVDENGLYEVQVRPYLQFPDAVTKFQMGLEKDKLKTIDKPAGDILFKYLSLGKTDSKNGVVTFFLKSSGPVGLDAIRLQKVSP
ncbi:MAG: DUF2961 domain-containing protein [Sedimentisphaerales bacterium]|nr:DUF2961 domain-containing protein [Sedimentisphaerales bacterium]